MPEFKSAVAANELLIDDSFPTEQLVDPVVRGDRKSRGLLRRDWGPDPFGTLPFAARFPSDIAIPENEWVDRISELESGKRRLTDLCDQAGLTVLDQDGTNYCWINAPVHCVEVIRVVAGQQAVRLSPASCGAPIKNYRNVGGWGTEGLKYIVSDGIVPQSSWPANAISRQYENGETRAMRAAYKVTEWWDLQPRNLKELITLLLLGIPVALGYNWWSHEVTGMDAVVVRSDPHIAYAAMDQWARENYREWFSMYTLSDFDEIVALAAT